MNLQFTRTGNGPVNFDTGIPMDYAGYLLPGALFLKSENDFGILQVQAIKGEHYSLHYNIYRFFQKISLTSQSLKEGLYARFVLKDHLVHRLSSVGRIHLREGQYSAIWSKFAECSSGFEKGHEYRMLDFYYTPAIVQQLAEFFPELQTVIEIEPDHPLLIGGRARRAGTVLLDIIRALLECPFDPNTSQFYFDMKSREFLFVLLNEIYNGKPASRIRLSSFERGKIQQAKLLLLENISRTPPTIRELSKMVSVNEFKLKKGFLELFGMSIFECLLQARMEKARELLMNTDLPIKFICAQAGYPRLSNFITAFRRRYGYTPGSLRRK